ncbi:hypothetical protein GCM10025868_06610 [Angustibacter aerolatus]|uniref:Cell division protein FtsZ C-terminal domain-containing protein n=1 Tax=Angustibacter aerolatus TaxID=1162965 RepID=A0ABQ6JCV9_9ACTN|nr:hypothetical protein [Angustibacter aerolatus]GMA85411.1 hypothetical protein GCM10025868_06610 [Angustibacter aerolatus]
MLLSIQGGSDLGLFEINEAARLVQEAAHPEANIIFGAVIDDALGDEVRVTVIAAGFDGGSPTKRPDDRALGQVSGRATLPAATPAQQAFQPAGQRPYTSGVSHEEAPQQPQAPAQQPQQAQPQQQAPQREEPIVVPDSLEPVRAGRGGRPSFDGGDDDLDVPDFLK